MSVIEATQRRRKKFAVDVPFVKQVSKAPEAADGDLELTGYANTWVQDRDGDWMARDAFDGSLTQFLSKNPILLYQHDMRKPLGVVNEMFTDATGLFARCTIPKPASEEPDWKHDAYWSCARGVVRTFSIGGFFTYDIENFGEEDEKWIIAEVELLELSVVSIPSNPDSIFEAAQKSLHEGDEENPAGTRMSDKAFAQMLQLLGLEELTDPELVSMDEAKRPARYEALGALFCRVKGREAPALDSYRQLVAPLERDDATLAQKLAVLPSIEDLVDELYAAPADGVKTGALPLLTKANHDRIQQAHDLLGEVLQQLPAAESPEGDSE